MERLGQTLSAGTCAQMIVLLMGGQGLQIVLEPDRLVTANAGILLTRALFIERSGPGGPSIRRSGWVG